MNALDWPPLSGPGGMLVRNPRIIFIAAGQYLTMLKVTYAPTWQHWEALLKIKVKISTGRASELMQLASGKKDLQQIRDGKAQSMAAWRPESTALRFNGLASASSWWRVPGTMR